MKTGEIIKINGEKEFLIISCIKYDGDNIAFLANVDNLDEQCIAVLTEEDDKIKVEILDLNSESNKNIIPKFMNLFEKDMLNHLKTIVGGFENE